MKFPVLWLASVSLSVWVGTEKKGVRLAWDLVSRSRITLHFGAKAVTKTKNQSVPPFERRTDLISHARSFSNHGLTKTYFVTSLKQIVLL